LGASDLFPISEHFRGKRREAVKGWGGGGASVSHREVAHADGVLQQPLEARRPAGHPLVREAPVDPGRARQAAVAGQAAVAAAALELHAATAAAAATTAVVWGERHRGRETVSQGVRE